MREPGSFFAVCVLSLAVTVSSGVFGADNKDPPKELRVAVAQIPVSRDIAANIKTISHAIEIAYSEKADILLTPEGSVSGYTPEFDQAAVKEAVQQLVDKASAVHLALALGTCYVEPDDKLCYNQILQSVNGGRNGSAWSREVYWPYHEANLRIRARTGKMWIVTADNCFPMNIPCSCPSGVLQPNGDWAVEVPDQGEHVVAYTIKLEE